MGPEVSFIIGSFLCSSTRERLARARPSPNGAIVSPSRAAQGMRPNADTSEEVHLGESFQITSLELYDAPLVNNTIRDVPTFDQRTEPVGCKGFDLVVKGCHIGLVAGKCLYMQVCCNSQHLPEKSRQIGLQH